MKNMYIDSPENLSQEILSQKDVPEIKELFKSVDWEPTYEAKNNVAKIPFGVRNTLGELVAFGAIRNEYPVGSLTDLCVRPDYRGNRIGEMLVRSRVYFADKVGFNSLYTILTPENKYDVLYEELGFTPLSTKLRILQRRIFIPQQ